MYINRILSLTISAIILMVFIALQAPTQVQAAQSTTEINKCLKNLGFEPIAMPVASKKSASRSKVRARKKTATVTSVTVIVEPTPSDQNTPEPTPSVKSAPEITSGGQTISGGTIINSGPVLIGNKGSSENKAMKRVLAPACYVFDADTVKGMLATVRVTPSKEFPKIKVVSGKVNGKLVEPGLLRGSSPGQTGLLGAEDFLTEMLVAETFGLWALAVHQGALLDRPSDQDIELYVKHLLDAVRSDPDGVVSLKLRAWERLKDVVLSPDKPSNTEQVFITAVEGYIKKQNIRMAREAQRKYKDYQAEKDRAVTGLTVLFHTGHAPYDALQEMKETLAVSAKTGGYLATMLGSKAIQRSVRNKVLKSLAAKLDDFDDDVVKWASGVVQKNLKKGGIKMGTRSAGKAGNTITKVISKGAKVPAKLAGKLAGRIATASVKVGAMVGTKLLNVVPIIGTIVDVIITSAEQLVKIGKNAAIEKRLKAAVDVAENGKWSLKEMFNSRGGTDMVAFYFAKATASSSPESVEITPPACRACFFSEYNYKGEYFCTGNRVSDLRNFNDGKEDRKFNNKARSVQMFADKTCQSPSVILHENQRHSGDKKILFASVPNLSKVRRGKKANWDKQATSVEYKEKGSPRCEVCFYKDANYKGTKICTDSPVGNLHSLGMGDRVSSIKFQTAACRSAKLWAYNKKDFKSADRGGGYAVYSKSTANVGKTWNDKFSSAYFSPRGINSTLLKAEGGCRVCLYDTIKHKGDYLCLSAGDKVPDLSKFTSGGTTYKFRNKASSVDFLTSQCKKGSELTLSLFSRAKYGGSQTVLTKDTYNLGKFNDKASSAKVVLRSAKKVAKSCHVCMYSQANYKGARRCFKRNEKSLKHKEIKFNNKTASIKFALQGCQKTGGAIFYEDEFKGQKFFAYKDIANLKKVRRGKKGNWNRVISSVKFDRKLRTQRAAAKRKAAATAKKRKAAVAASCKVCLYENSSYKGKSFCTLPGVVPKLSAHKLNNRVSSVSFKGKACAKARLSLYEDPKYKSYKTVITKDVSYLGRLKLKKGSKKTWNDVAGSFKFTLGK